MLTVLVADDEFAVLEVLSMALEGEGHRVLKAGDGADALRILSHQACDIVICDENMPMMNGHQLIAAMRVETRFTGISIILMADTWGRPLPEIDGVVVIGKPVMLSELFAAVEAAGPRKS